MSDRTGAAGERTPLLTLTAPGAAGTVIPTAFWAEEQLSQPFLMTVEFLSSVENLDPNAMLYQPVCLAVQHWEGPVRYFHGLVRRFASGTTESRDFWSYSIEVVPKLWFMTQTEDCRIFQQQTAQDILQTLFSEAGVSPVQFKIYGDKPTREYTTQFNETDFAFASRLMQEEGWFYFFQHEPGSHTLIVTDQNTAFQALDQPNVDLVDAGYEHSTLTGWQTGTGTALGKTELKDYDLTKPTNPPDATENTTLKAAGASARDAFHWPALSTDTSVVTARTRNWIEAAEASAAITDGAGRHNGFCPGSKFVLAKDPRSGATSQSYAIRSVMHHGTGNVQWSGGPEEIYLNSFTCFPASIRWRDMPTVPHPRMSGLYSAVVIGPEGEEIYTDQYGRVEVLFPWDHRSDSAAGKSVWLRVVQPWAGKTWGWQHIPRVGTEVAVAFMDGDPDRPVVAGGLYNADCMPPFALPDQKTKTGLRTRSTLQGGTSNYSEFSIDDKKGQELVFLHAEKDHTIEVEHDQNLTVDNCRIKTVKADETVTIGNNQSIEIQQGNRSVTLDQGNDALLLKMGDRSTKLSMGNMSVELSLGNLSTKADVGKIDENAMQSITMTVGASSIKIDQMGVTISGMMIKIDGQIQVQVQGLMTQVNGEALLQAKGGIVMIN